jgi:hypothetical protein
MPVLSGKSGTFFRHEGDLIQLEVVAGPVFYSDTFALFSQKTALARP